MPELHDSADKKTRGHSGNGHPSTRRRQDARQDLDRSAFPRSIWSKQSGNLALVQAERYLVQNLSVAISEDESVDFNAVWHICEYCTGGHKPLPPN